MSVGKVFEIDKYVFKNLMDEIYSEVGDERSDLASAIVYRYEDWNGQRGNKIDDWEEVQSYIFATDTRTTTNGENTSWKNSTTTPKLTQIRDNLHANYMQAIFGSQNWFKWVGADGDSVLKDKANAIEAYLENKIRSSEFYSVASQLLYDYIDYGNAIADVEYVTIKQYDPMLKEDVIIYTGPRAKRVSPEDIVFNPLSVRFTDSPNIKRIVKTMGDLLIDLKEQPQLGYDEAAVKALADVRNYYVTAFDRSDSSKSSLYNKQGFGDLMEYYQSDVVELLEFEGTIRDGEGNMYENKIITVADRSKIIRIIDNPSWTGKTTKVHTGWRKRPNNLWAMGPLDNLVGLQYRIDHLENTKADLYDLIAHPPLKIKGNNVEEFEWAPFAEVYCGDDGDIEVLKVDSVAITADMQIDILERRMEDMAGAPRQAMGVRTPGEKTAFEVQSLQNAASRIFEEKTRQFEIELLEPLLNNMLEISRRNLKTRDTIRIIDNDFGAAQFLDITREDITGKGKLYPLGSRHWVATNNMIQNLTGIFNSQIGQIISKHIDPMALAHMVEDAFEWEKYGLIKDNAAIVSDQETQRMINSSQDELMAESMTQGTE